MAAGDERIVPFAEILRPDDLLYLRVGGINLRLENDPEGEAYLTVSNPDQPAFLHINCQPQTIAESAFFEASIVKPETKTPDPDPDHGSTVHEPFSTPGSPAKNASAAAQIAHSSRLVFEVPNGTQIPFTESGLLDWSALRLSVNPIAALGDNPSAHEIATAPAIAEPAPNETAIELPYRLVISPTRDVTWIHRPLPFTIRGRTELWHTQLALREGNQVTRLSKTNLAPLRAIWSADYAPLGRSHVAHPNVDPSLGRTAMNGDDRHQIVVLTSGFHGYEVERKPTRWDIGFGGGIAKAGFDFPRWVSFVPQPFHADRLMLSALGGWLRSRGQWDPPRPVQSPPRIPLDVRSVLDRINLREAFREPVQTETEAAHARRRPIHDTTSLDLSEWVHLATQGRDHYVRIVYEGELWPFRHPAALIKVTERKFEENGGIVGAYLMQRMFIVVRKPVMTFAGDDRGNPLKEVRLTTVVTPDIAVPEVITDTTRSFWVKVVKGPTLADTDFFRFHGIARDGLDPDDRNVIDFTIPLMFVSIADIRNSGATAKAASEYNDRRNADFRQAFVPGEKVAFAPRDPAKPTDTTQLVTRSVNFIVDPARVQPALLKAEVVIPQVQELIGTNDPTTIRLSPDYVNKGLADPANRTGLFAEIVKSSYDALGSTETNGGLGLNIEAQKAGGIATPNMSVTTLSRALGPLAGKVEDALSDTFDPAQFFPRGLALLFGSFDLVDMFLPSGGSDKSLGKNAPKMRTERQDGGQTIVTLLDWEPEFLPNGSFDAGFAAITKNNGSKLSINGEIRKPLDATPPQTKFNGSLNSFTVSVFKSVFINFESFTFRSESGHKVEVNVALDNAEPLRFDGDLRFVEEIRQAIPPGLFGDGASLELIANPLGIRAGFAFALPPLTVGVFTLKDVKLGAAITLPFLDGKPLFDFNISERAHPFLLAVSIFGGGGFFHLQLDTAGMKALEVALEFGATAAIDLGVASGEVHIMAGIYFSLQRKEGSTELAAVLSGYLRLGGSLNVLGLIKVTVEFNLSFTYDSGRDKAYGRATLTVSVEVLFFSTSVELTVERAFGGSGDPHFIDFFPEPEPWEEYALAFA